MRQDESYHRKLKKYSYNGKIVRALNKDEAMDRLKLPRKVDQTLIKRMKA